MTSEGSPIRRGSGGLLSPSQVRALAYVFANADANGDGCVDSEEMGSLLRDMGHQFSDVDVGKIMQQLDANADATLSFEEFKNSAPLVQGMLLENEPKPLKPAPVPKGPNPVSKGPNPVLKGPKLTSKAPIESSTEDLETFLKEINFHSKDAYQHLMANGITVAILKDIINDKRKASALYGALKLPPYMREKLAYGVAHSQIRKLLRMKRMALVISIPSYEEPQFFSSKANVEIDGDLLSAQFVRNGYTVAQVNKDTPPTQQTLQSLIRTVCIRQQCMQSPCQALVIFVSGSAFYAPPEEEGNPPQLQILALDSPYKQPSGALSLESIFGYFMGCNELMIVCEFDNVYQLDPSGNLVHTGQGMGVLAYAGDIQCCWHITNPVGIVAQTLSNLMDDQQGNPDDRMLRKNLTAILKNPFYEKPEEEDPEKMVRSIILRDGGRLPRSAHSLATVNLQWLVDANLCLGTELVDKLNSIVSGKPKLYFKACVTAAVPHGYMALRLKRDLTPYTFTTLEQALPKFLEQETVEWEIQAMDDPATMLLVIKLPIPEVKVLDEIQMTDQRRNEERTKKVLDPRPKSREDRPSSGQSNRSDLPGPRPNDLPTLGIGVENESNRRIRSAGRDGPTVLSARGRIGSNANLTRADSRNSNASMRKPGSADGRKSADRRSSMAGNRSRSNSKASPENARGQTPTINSPRNSAKPKMNKLENGTQNGIVEDDSNSQGLPLHRYWHSLVLGLASKLEKRGMVIANVPIIGPVFSVAQVTMEAKADIIPKLSTSIRSGADPHIHSIKPDITDNQPCTGLMLSDLHGAKMQSIMGSVYIELSEEQLNKSCPRPNFSPKAPNYNDIRQRKRDETLSAAFAHLKEGQVLQLPPGTFEGRFIIDKPNIAIRGSDSGETIITVSGAEAENGPLLDIRSSHCWFENLTLVGTSKKHPTVLYQRGNSALRNCKISGFMSSVVVHPEAYPLITSCQLINSTTGSGVVFKDGARGIVEHCDIMGNRDAGVVLTGHGSNPWVYKCNITQGKGSGVFVEKRSTGIFILCEISGNACPGMLVVDESRPVVSKCTFNRNKGCGVSVVHCDGGRFEGNFFNGNGEAEFKVQHTKGIILRRNQMHKEHGNIDPTTPFTDVAINLDNTDGCIEHQGINGYRVGIIMNRCNSRNQLSVVCNTICVGETVDPIPLRVTDSRGLKLRFNDCYYQRDVSQGDGTMSGSLNWFMTLKGLSIAKAAEASAMAVMRELVRTGADLNEVDMGTTALIACIRNDAITQVKQLLEWRANPNKTDTNGVSPLHVAVNLHYPEIVRLLIKGGADIEHHNGPNYPRALNMAAMSGSVEMTELLLEHDADPSTPQNPDGDNILHLLLKQNILRFDIVTILLNAGMDVNATNKLGYTPLCSAILDKRNDAIELLTQCKADTQSMTSEGHNALSLACTTSNIKCMETLIKAKADVNHVYQGTGGYTLLLMAAEKGDYAVMELLLQHGASATIAKKSTGDTPLHLAVMRGHAKAVKLLLKTSDITTENTSGLTPWHYTPPEMRDLVQDPHLLNAINLARTSEGVDKLAALGKLQKHIYTAKLPESWTTLMQACLYGNRRAINVVIDGLARPAQEDSNGFTAMFYVLLVGWDQVVKMMEKMNIHPTAKDNAGIKALQDALAEGELGAEQYLNLGWEEVKKMADKDAKEYSFFPAGRSMGGGMLQGLKDRMNNAAAMPTMYSGLREVSKGDKALVAQSPSPVPIVVDDDLDAGSFMLPRMGADRGGRSPMRRASHTINQCVMEVLNELPISTNWQVRTKGQRNPPMEVVTWDLKWVIITAVAANRMPVPMETMAAIYVFTYESDVSRNVLKLLKQPSNPKLMPYKPIIAAINTALMTLPVFTGSVYMVASEATFDLHGLMADPDGYFHYSTYVSGTRDVNVARMLVTPESVLYVIKSKTGRDISSCSYNEWEKEVLFDRTSKFHCQSVISDGTLPGQHNRYLQACAEFANKAGGPGAEPHAIVYMSEL